MNGIRTHNLSGDRYRLHRYNTDNEKIYFTYIKIKRHSSYVKCTYNLLHKCQYIHLNLSIKNKTTNKNRAPNVNFTVT